ncbi:unnamed protein product [Brassicogethes aeneus]|uniref:Signal recognition particle subunit SRP68 n=1 Tax=Brassicogethes aeneus TaxID=1431903 RepID=A0A9P0BIC8_BRAAE|nr:unnamed protein product [Brassicogethes aeneus]
MSDESKKNLSEEETTKQKPEPEPLKPFTLEILKLIKDAQQQHGLRHGDYQRYRSYCSRRIRRLRKVLKIPQGDRRHFKKRDVTEQHIANSKADERYLQIPLMLSERCWAYAMQLRQEANSEPRKKFHLVQKLRKACTYAMQLDELCKQERCDARTQLESQAYIAWIKGSLQFELKMWLKATENLKKAQVIYEKLISALPEEDQIFYKQRCEEITPSLRYCAYNIGDDKAVDLLELRSQGVLENFEALVSQTKEKTAAILHEITWFGVKIPVRLERVRLFLISIEKLDESLKHAEDNQAKIKILENLFIDLRDVISLTRDSARTEKQDQMLLSYLISIRVERTSQRNLLLIKQTRKPQDCVRLLDINIQQTNELSQNENIKGISKVLENHEGHLKAYKALRSYYLGRTTVSQKRWKEAALLFDTSLKAVQALPKGNFLEELTELLNNVKENAQMETVNAQANFVLDQSEETTTVQVPQKQYKSKKPIIERLDEFREEPQLLSKNPNLVPIPPQMEPVPAKPLFYDLALNFVEYPDLSEKLEGGQKKQQNQGAGISGFVKGLWGWGKNSQTKEKTAAILHEITWFGVKIPVRLERVRLFLISIEKLDESLKHAEDNQAKIKILENLFIDLRDVISLTRDSARTEKQDQMLLSYLISIRVERTSQRNLLLIKQTRKPQDCVRLLDINIQQTNELSQNENIKGISKVLENHEGHLKALRSYYLGRTTVSQKRWKEAALLFDASLKAVQALPKGNFLKELLNNVKENAQMETVNAQANFVLDQSEETTTVQVPQKQYKSKKPIIERLDEFREEPQLLSKNPNLVPIPPQMEPVPAKPLFYDLALNFVEYPDLSEKLEGGQKKQQNQGAGISGFVKGLWGWGKNSQTKEKTAAILHEITWFGVKIPVRLERVRLFLISIEKLDESLKHAEDNQPKIKILENLFIDLRDVISLTRDSARTEKQDQMLLSYLISIRVERTSQRNLLLIKQTRKPQDCVRLLDINIQQTNELSHNENIKGISKVLDNHEGHLKAYKALRSYYLGRTTVSQKRWKEAALLFDASLKAVQALPKGNLLEELTELLNNVKENAQMETVNAQANFVLDQSEETTTVQLPQKQYKSKKPIIERLDEFREEPQLLSKNPNLVPIPPQMEPVPAKPLFYDLALNFVEYPDLSEKLEGGQKKQQNQGAGISGFVKGLWGWGKK